MHIANLTLRASRWPAVVCHKIRAFATALLIAPLLVAGPVQAAGQLDGNEDFKLLAALGFEEAVDGAHPEGNQLNSYAWSMAWFKGKLYVGTGRFETDGTFSSLPTMRAQIWAYTPGGTGGASGTWEVVLESPMGFISPRDFGYRWMTKCTFNGVEHLFISTIGWQQGNILRTTDGVNFTPLSRIGIPTGTVGFRSMVCFDEPNGRRVLVTSSVGTGGDATTFDSDSSDSPIALVNDNPAGAGQWRNYSPFKMGDPDNNAFFTMYAFGGNLYAGVTNKISGAQLWRTPGCTRGRSYCEPTWTKLIDRGGGRKLRSDGLALNAGISDMMAHNGDLYLALSTAVLVTPTTAEMWRLRPDDTFEVLVGEARLQYGDDPDLASGNKSYPASLRCGQPLEDIDGIGGANDCPPTSRRGAGYGTPGTAATGYPDGNQFYFWRLLHYAYHPTDAPQGDDRLYMGTFQGIVRGVPTVFGFDLLATEDGVNWTTITNNSFGDLNQLGMRAIASSPIGLFVGGANYPTGRTGEIGGCDVWLGTLLLDSVNPTTTISTPPSPTEGEILTARDANFAWTGADLPAPGSLPLTYAYRLDPLEPSFSAFGAATTRNYANLANGSYTFLVIARDGAGNTEAAGATPGDANRRTFTVNAPDLPPSVVLNSVPASPSVSGNVAFAWTGSDDLTPPASLVFDFWLEPLQTDPGTFTGSTGTTFNSLIDGSYVFHVKARDASNNVGAEATSGFTVARPPETQIDSGPTGSINVASATFTFSGTDDAPGPLTYSSRLVGFDAGFSAFDSATSRNYVNLPDAAYTFEVVARDVTGNTDASPATRAFTVAVNVPQPPDAPAPATASLIAARTVEITWPDVAGESHYNVQRCRSDPGPCSYFTVAANLAADSTSHTDVLGGRSATGTFSYRVQACGSAGCSAWTTSNDVVVP